MLACFQLALVVKLQISQSMGIYKSVIRTLIKLHREKNVYVCELLIAQIHAKFLLSNKIIKNSDLLFSSTSLLFQIVVFLSSLFTIFLEFVGQHPLIHAVTQSK